MRRTLYMVPVLAGLVSAALSSPLLQAQNNSAPPRARTHSTPSATRSHKKTGRHPGVHRASRKPVRSSPCPAVTTVRRKTNHGAARPLHASAKLTAKRPEEHLQPRLPDAVRAPAREPSPPTPPIDSQSSIGLPAPTPAKPSVKPASLNRKQLMLLPPMRGSLASLERQNERTEAEGLERIEDEDDLSDRIARKFLVPVPASAILAVNPELPEHHRYCRPWTARFLADLSRAHAAQFHDPIEVTSAVRTVAYQKHLIEVNGNAAAAEGDIASPHLTGASVDIAKKGMSRQQIGWMRYWLTPLQAAGKIDVEEEFQQSCFHITVYKSYAPAKPPSTTLRAKATRKADGQPGDGQQKASPQKPRRLDRDIAGVTAPLGR